VVVVAVDPHQLVDTRAELETEIQMAVAQAVQVVALQSIMPQQVVLLHRAKEVLAVVVVRLLVAKAAAVAAVKVQQVIAVTVTVMVMAVRA
jgi:hypothetical protein